MYHLITVTHEETCSICNMLLIEPGTANRGCVCVCVCVGVGVCVRILTRVRMLLARSAYDSVLRDSSKAIEAGLM